MASAPAPLSDPTPPAREPDAPTWGFRLDFDCLREASAVRQRDPYDFDSAVLTYFGLGGRDDGAIIERMRTHPEGARIVRERIPLPKEVLDPAPLAALPADTLGHRYWAHTQAHGLDPMLLATRSARIAERYPMTAEHRFVYDRYRDLHDLWHVVLGYGTDMAGEAAIVGFTYAQLRNKGYLLICLLNAMMCTKRGRPDVFKTARVGYRHGQRSPLLLAVDWRRWLDVPLERVRGEIGVEPAAAYREFFIDGVPGRE